MKKILVYTNLLIRYIQHVFAGDSSCIMKQFENWWLSGSEIALVTIPYMFNYISPCVPSYFTQCFCNIFKRFSCFFQCFSLFCFRFYVLVPPMRISLRHSKTSKMFSCRTDNFKKFFTPSVATEWNKVDLDIQQSSWKGIFRNVVSKFIRLVVAKPYSGNNFTGLKLLTRLRAGSTHL